MPSPTFTYSDDLVRAAMASERMLELQRNAEKLVDELDYLISVALTREYPAGDPFEINEALVAEAQRRFAAEVVDDA